ncbi:MAG: endonuclease/exonuclease/phosphatase family protein [Flavobacterium sp.]|nr:MAG: endonuclease/exonuclease/phosphatase family protein [Flavobacterium sp.]
MPATKHGNQKQRLPFYRCSGSQVRTTRHLTRLFKKFFNISSKRLRPQSHSGRLGNLGQTYKNYFMKIISWNCCMAFRKKMGPILKKKPDLLIIQECEPLDKFDFDSFSKKPTSQHWCGYKDGKKGVAIFSFGKYSFRVHDLYSEDFSIVVPIILSDGSEEYNIIAVWTLDTKVKGGHYVDQIWRAIDYYDSHITTSRTILIGDFNSNVIFDKKTKESSHGNMVIKLAKKGIVSAYHEKHKQKQGTERHPTFYLYRHQDKPYHLDHCFISGDMLSRLKKVEIGKYDDWSALSDHSPLTITFS